MNVLSKLSIAQKLLLIPVIAIVSFVAYVIMTSYTANHNVEIINAARQVQFPALIASQKALIEKENVANNLENAVTTGDEESLEKAQKSFEKASFQLASIKQLSSELANDIIEIEQHFTKYFDIAYGVSVSMVDGTADFSKLAGLTQEMNDEYSKATEKLENFNIQQLDLFEKKIAQANSAAENLSVIGFVMGGLTSIVLLIVALPIVHNLRRSIVDVVNSLKDIAKEDGDLTKRITTNNKDEIGDLVYWFNQFVAKLQSVVSDIGESSKPLSKLANNLHDVASDARSTIAAQQLSAAEAKNEVETMNNSVNAVALSASEAASAATDASQAADDGQRVVNQTVDSIQVLASRVDETAVVIKRLEEDSNQVGVVLDVIKGIAEQTNLLALNAAIEAARAGEQGRGFAVVADEVRTLASRTQQSTEEIQNTIEQLQNAARSAVTVMAKGTEQATQSVEEANQAGSSLNAITETISRITAMNDKIAQSTGEQKSVAELISNNVNDINTRTENTASSSEKLTMVSHELESLSEEFSRIMKQFKY